MAQKKKNASPRRRASGAKPQPKRERVQRVIQQVKEPLSLLQTLREEGLANAVSLFSMASSVASEAARNLRPEALQPQINEWISSLGLVRREELERLAERVEELEQRLAERDYAALRTEAGEEE